MNKRSLGIRRTLVLLAMGGAFALFPTFGPTGFGCNYANNADYAGMYQAAGDYAIDTISANYFTDGTDWNALVQIPATAFAHNVWANWLDAQIPDDLPNNAVVLR